MKNRGSQTTVTAEDSKPATPPVAQPTTKASPVSVNGQNEIIEMDHMRKMIAHHMAQSIQTSAHVQSFIEVDVTNIVKWRSKVKDTFEKREGEDRKSVV